MEKMEPPFNPSTAIEICPRSMATKIYYVSESNKILKTSRRVRVAEADAMRLVADQTQIPVPEVFDAYERDGIGYIWMSKIEGQPLSDVFFKLSEEDFHTIISQLSRYIKELRTIKGTYFGCPGGQPCPDIFFSHNQRSGKETTYGPYTSRKEYNYGLVQALENSRPTGVLSKSDNALISRLMTLQQEEMVFTHGDLHLNNIFVNESLDIVGILDWGEASYSICEREFFEARSRARSPRWIEAIERCVPSIPEDHYRVLQELEQQLVVYSGF